MPRRSQRLLAVKIHPLGTDAGEVDPPPVLVAHISEVVRRWNSDFVPSEFQLREDTDGFVASNGEYVATDRVFKAYVPGPFTVAHARELADHIARFDTGQFSVWVELRDEEGAGRYVAAFDISYGRVTRDEVPE